VRKFRRLVIKNFQSHEHTELVFGPGLNVVVGPSDHGKSAIVRALRWLVYNEPRGTAFVREGADSCRVTLELDDGTVVVRERTARAGGYNRYVVSRPGAGELVLEGFGTRVPEEVTEALGMPEVYLDEDRKATLNFASQLEGPFLLSDTGATRAKAIGRLLGVHVIDAAIRDTSRDLARSTQESSRLRSEIQALDEKLELFKDLPAQGKAVEDSTSALKAARSAWERHLRLAKLSERLRSVGATLERTRLLLGRLEPLDEADDRFRRADSAVRRCSALERLARRRQRVEDEEASARRTLGRTASLPEAARALELCGTTVGTLAALERRRERLRAVEHESARLHDQLRPTAGLERGRTVIDAGIAPILDRLKRLETLGRSLREAESRIATGRRYLRDRNVEIAAVAGEYGRALRSLGRCPLCMNRIDARTIERIMREAVEEGTQ